jgi:preprotein translocase subunit SecD
MSKRVLVALVLLALVTTVVHAAEGGLQIIVGAKGEEQPASGDLRTAALVIASRLKALDVQPYRVQLLDGQRIQVQLPPVQNQEQTIAAITSPGLLELVDFSDLGGGAVDYVGKTIATTGREAADSGKPLSNPTTQKPFETVLTGAAVKSASAHLETYGQWTIHFKLKPDGARTFGDYTESHIGKPLAIVIDGVVISVPVIQARLSDEGIISGNFTQETAKLLAAQLQYGALNLSLEVESIGTFESVVP